MNLIMSAFFFTFLLLTIWSSTRYVRGSLNSGIFLLTTRFSTLAAASVVACMVFYCTTADIVIAPFKTDPTGNPTGLIWKDIDHHIVVNHPIYQDLMMRLTLLVRIAVAYLSNLLVLEALVKKKDKTHIYKIINATLLCIALFYFYQSQIEQRWLVVRGVPFNEVRHLPKTISLMRFTSINIILLVVQASLILYGLLQKNALYGRNTVKMVVVFILNVGSFIVLTFPGKFGVSPETQWVLLIVLYVCILIFILLLASGANVEHLLVKGQYIGLIKRYQLINKDNFFKDNGNRRVILDYLNSFYIRGYGYKKALRLSKKYLNEHQISILKEELDSLMMRPLDYSIFPHPFVRFIQKSTSTKYTKQNDRRRD